VIQPDFFDLTTSTNKRVGVESNENIGKQPVPRASSAKVGHREDQPALSGSASAGVTNRVGPVNRECRLSLGSPS